jgi:NADPH:quinone reductase-like Zn-dependent oxidoreductase
VRLQSSFGRDVTRYPYMIYPVPPHASQILGVEYSGVVEEVGSEPDDDDPSASILRAALKKWKKDDEVYGLAYGGAYAEYIVVHATHIMRKPAGLSFVEAASIPEVWITGASHQHCAIATSPLTRPH